MLCARSIDSPNRGVGIRDRVGADRGIGGRVHRCMYASPNTRICAEIKRMAAAADAAAAAKEGCADGGWRDDCSAAPVSPWPTIPDLGSTNARARLFSPRATFLMVNRSVGKGKRWQVVVNHRLTPTAVPDGL